MLSGRGVGRTKMESAALVAPVTALEFAGDVLLAGEPGSGSGSGGGAGGGGG